MHSRNNERNTGGTRSPPYINHLFSVKIDNLPYRSNMSDVERAFKKFGRIGDIYIPRDSRTHEIRGFAFVRYYEERDAEDAIDAMDGTAMDSREIRVSMARNGRPTDNRPNGRQNQYDTPHRQGGSRYSRDTRDQSDRFGSTSYDRERGNNRDRKHSPRRRRSSPESHSMTKAKNSFPSPRYHKRSPSKSPQRRSRSPVRKQFRTHTRSRSHSG